MSIIEHKKKDYFSPEIDIIKLSFEEILENIDTSVAEGGAAGGANGPGDGDGEW